MSVTVVPSRTWYGFKCWAVVSDAGGRHVMSKHHSREKAEWLAALWQELHDVFRKGGRQGADLAVGLSRDNGSNTGD
jgi:hypothetical protein